MYHLAIHQSGCYFLFLKLSNPTIEEKLISESLFPSLTARHWLQLTFPLQATLGLPSERALREIIFHLCQAKSRLNRSINLTISSAGFVLVGQKSVCVCLQNTVCVGLGSTVAVSCGIVSELSIGCFLVCVVWHGRVLNCRNQLFCRQTYSTGTLYSVYVDVDSLLYNRVVWWQKQHCDIWYTLFLDFQLWLNFVCIDASHLTSNSFCGHQDFSSLACLFILPCQKYLQWLLPS